MSRIDEIVARTFKEGVQVEQGGIYFMPDPIGEVSCMALVEDLLGGIGQVIHPDGQLQFAEQDDRGFVPYSPKLPEAELEAFCEQYMEQYRAFNAVNKDAINEGVTLPPIEPFWSGMKS